MERDIAKFIAVELRLRDVITSIVRRHLASGEVLSWTLMFDIEEEALRHLGADPGLDARFIGLMAAPAPDRSKEGPVCMGDVNGMRTTLWMIQEAYYHGR